MTQKKFVVEGFYDEGGQTTGDYVMAPDKEAAVLIVEKARGEDWTANGAGTFEDHIASLQRTIATMQAMTDEDVDRGWTETQACLGSDYEDEEAN